SFTNDSVEDSSAFRQKFNYYDEYVEEYEKALGAEAKNLPQNKVVTVQPGTQAYTEILMRASTSTDFDENEIINVISKPLDGNYIITQQDAYTIRTTSDDD